MLAEANMILLFLIAIYKVILMLQMFVGIQGIFRKYPDILNTLWTS